MPCFPPNVSCASSNPPFSNVPLAPSPYIPTDSTPFQPIASITTILVSVPNLDVHSTHAFVLHHNGHSMQTQSKSDIVKPKVYLTTLELAIVVDALQQNHWKATMIEEFLAFMCNNTWSLVQLPPNRKAIGYK